MTNSIAGDLSTIERIRRRTGQAGFVVGVVGLSFGTALFLLNQAEVSTWVLMTTVGVLLTMPVVNVVAVLAEEVRQRDWGFAALAVGVLALLGWAVFSRVVEALQHKSL
jgi:hypothetical protein